MLEEAQQLNWSLLIGPGQARQRKLDNRVWADIWSYMPRPVRFAVSRAVGIVCIAVVIAWFAYLVT